MKHQSSARRWRPIATTPLTSYWALLLVMIGTTTNPSILEARAFRIFDQSAAAMGQGAAFTAAANDPSAIYYNPAGLTQLEGVQTSAGLLFAGGSVTFTSPTGDKTRGDAGGGIAVPPPTHLYLTANLGDLGFKSFDGISAGLGIISSFGTATEYPDDGPFSTAVTSASLPLVNIKPTLAYKINDFLSIGLGADIYTFASFLGEGQFELQSRAGAPIGPISRGPPTEFNGTGTTAGVNASVMLTPFRNNAGQPIAQLGLIYRSQATLDLRGEFLANSTHVADASSTFVLPQSVTAGLSVWPLRRDDREWRVEVDVDYTGWRSFRNLDINLSNGATLPVPQDWNSSTTIMLGTEHKWHHLSSMPDWHLALRGGYWYSMTPIPDRTFNPAVPDADENSLSFGFGLLCGEDGSFFDLFGCNALGKEIGIDFAYRVILSESRTVTGNLNPTVNGTYEPINHIGALTLRMNF